jgi:hypothetical protein
MSVTTTNVPTVGAVVLVETLPLIPPGFPFDSDPDDDEVSATFADCRFPETGDGGLASAPSPGTLQRSRSNT